MTRTLTALALGLTVGVAATLLLRPSPIAPPEIRDLGLLAPPVTSTNAVVSTAAREGGRDFYRRLADASSVELGDMITQAASEPKSMDRELALAVLLKRYSELDAVGAVRARATHASAAWRSAPSMAHGLARHQGKRSPH